MALSQIYKEHQNNLANVIKADREHAKEEARTAVSAAIDVLHDAVNVQVSEAFQLQRNLESESRRLETLALDFVKQSRLWLDLVNQFNDALKELGDIENWSKIIAKDARSIVGTVQRVSGVLEEESLGSSSVELKETGPPSMPRKSMSTDRDRLTSGAKVQLHNGTLGVRNVD
ncbi:hypothetical protein SeLEV6574_g06617 [Synchytrium endobioticum]|uniref:Biogenesis of lysosome-related organelles complex 1 subunit 1 n=1 Tax=Synchytrium endobioticum TaxID=286115 RepID=A0A507CKW3_9FUNG|nr:hypothetical protein SeLEV6574_g06617 [Synchytrium endobioticum]